MADKPAATRKFELPLTRREVTNVVLLGLVVGGLAYGLDLMLSGQRKELEEQKKIASGVAQLEEQKKIKSQIDEAAKLRKRNKAWGTLLKAAESFFPSDASRSVTYDKVIECLASVKGTVVLVSKEEEPVELDFLKDPPPEDGTPEAAALAAEKEAHDADPNYVPPPEEETLPDDLLVKYTEKAFNFKIQTTYPGWLEFLANLERFKGFYRLKKVSISSGPKASRKDKKKKKKKDPKAADVKEEESPADEAIIVEFELASYFIKSIGVKPEEGS